MLKNLFTALATLFSVFSFAQSSTIQPNTGSQGQTLPIIISGQNVQFQSGSPTVSLHYSQGSGTISQGTITGFSNIQVNSPSQISGTLVIPSNAANGSYNLFVNAGTSTFDLSAFTVQPATSNSIQMIPNGIKPGNTISGLSVSVPAASFKNAMSGIAKVWLSKGSIVLDNFTNISVQSASSFTADFSTPANVSQGMYDMNVYENSGAMHVLVNAFEIAPDVSLADREILQYSFYPNPTSDILKVEFSGADQESTFEILDLNGRLIQSHTISATEGKFSFSVASLAKGMYLIRLRNQAEVLSVQKWQKD
ncbi:MAG: T9SS type A sorting domain-containing protein [Bacteroidetes bacterium]|nr:T9SS type A sorting domain-containing protein [Bacteroidota bacterium]